MYKRYIDNINLYKHLTTFGNLDTPVIKATNDLDLNTKIIPFNIALNIKRNHEQLGVHFFIDDYQFERLWNRPMRYVDVLKKFKYIIAPDFSLYTDFHKGYQIYNHYRKHALAALLQSQGITVIPTLSWSDKQSFSWCFDGIERGSIVACSSVGTMLNKKSKRQFIVGFKKAVEIIDPKKVIFFGVFPKELLEYEHLIIKKESYQEKHRQKKDVV